MLLISGVNHAVVANQLSAIETLIGSNYTKQKRDTELTLGLMELDLALIELNPDSPDAIAL